MYADKSNGFSLLELMITLLIGLVFIMGLIKTTITCNDLFLYQQSIAQLQENARSALNLLSNEIRIAGLGTLDEGIKGYSSSTELDFAQRNLMRWRNKTDILVVKHLNPNKEVNTYVFYIGDTQRKDKSGKSLFALYRVNLQYPREPSEMVEGVDSMRLMYGLNSEEDPNGTSQKVFHYVNANSVKNWRKVKSVHAVLSLNSMGSNIHPEWGVVVALRELNHER